ncbi:hypothetical protein TTHERM_00571680 (macronuclear) [Tetrahymena thermophila SB210]|uniref:Uncharacterized protein n=1 Tax=Tetrahymena thermophila (strain SB210) TaxID=312017 RepID=Q24I06_TETTS|nr:hypothetical protein TTHERM_00571680 [Tetrahymena thermophila SB210]EAS07432.2 hypothetical protein TTHERM_00571680 [Tetrahymena thermophila SB210]|eukprot:XP_001027674.2 hypothetical protein TTHERM_00571680 [Tetrahymena thermophila SB210]
MDVRKPIIDNFSHHGKFFDCVNSSRNQSNLRQINVLQEIQKQSLAQSKYQKLLENIKSKTINEILDQNKSTDQELTKEVHNYYAEMQKIFPRAINKNRISSFDKGALSRSIEENEYKKQQKCGQSNQQSVLNESQVGKSKNISKQKSFLNDYKSSQQTLTKSSKKDEQQHSKVKFSIDNQIDSIKIKNNQKNKKGQKRSIFHILSDSDDQLSQSSDRGKFVSEEYAASKQVFSVNPSQQQDEESRQTIDKVCQSDLSNLNSDIQVQYKRHSIIKTPTKNNHFTPKSNNFTYSNDNNFISKDSNLNLKDNNLNQNDSNCIKNHRKILQTEPENSPNAYNIHTDLSSLYDVSEKGLNLNIQKRFNQKYKPINSSLNGLQIIKNNSGFACKYQANLKNTQILEPLNISEKQNKSFCSKLEEDSSANNSLFDQRNQKYNRDFNSRNSSSFSINYDNGETSLEKKSKFQTLQQTQKQNKTEFYYGCITPINNQNKLNQLPNSQQKRQKSSSNESRLYHFDFIKQDLSPTMHKEKKSLRIIQRLFEQSQEIQKVYKNTENKISKIQHCIYDNLQKTLETMEDDTVQLNQIDEPEDNYQQLLIHTGLTSNQENIDKFKVELKKNQSQVLQEASNRNMQKLKKGNSNNNQQNQVKKEFPVQKMPYSMNKSGKFQALVQLNNINLV